MTYSENSKLGDLLDNGVTRTILERHLKGILEHPQLGNARSMTLKMIAGFSKGLISEGQLTACSSELRLVTIPETRERNFVPNAHALLSRRAAAQGMVLLENRGNALPLRAKSIALFGRGAYATIKGGTGSGNSSSPYVINIWDGLRAAGFNITSEGWLRKYRDAYEAVQDNDKTLSAIQKYFSGMRIDVPDPLLTDDDLRDAKEADAAIYVISRQAGEVEDRKPQKGDYYLTDVEERNLTLLSEEFSQTIVILNSAVMDTGFFRENSKLNSLLLMSYCGMEGGNALADVLSGVECPSGKLTDTWAKSYTDYPASKNFGTNGDNGKQQDYREGIYVGYRYFDSFGITPAYPFGYGLSYTTFRIETRDVRLQGENVTVSVCIKNIGDRYKGREVIQAYVSAASGMLDKPRRILTAYRKTSEILPGCVIMETLSFNLRQMASYDENRAAWILEAGDYHLLIGNSSRNTHVAAIFRLNEEIITEQLSNRLPLDGNFEDLVPDSSMISDNSEEVACGENVRNILINPKDIITHQGFSRINTSGVTTFLTEKSDYISRYAATMNSPKEEFHTLPSRTDAKLYDVYSGKMSMIEFVAQLDLPALSTLLNGTFSDSTYEMDAPNPITKATILKGSTSGSTTGNFVKSHGIPATLLADGPAGLHLADKADSCTAFPAGMLLAQTWDPDLVREIGIAYGEEMVALNISIALAPGINIHRDPLCGRNFEYYSEDPLVTGYTATAFTRGLQSLPGIGVALKHFAANNQETYRVGGNSSVSERALREIYLKGFEITVKNARPMTIMTSYNKLNGIHTSSNLDLVTHILRGEWGFDGYVMTDWFGDSDHGLDIRAGNDMIMGGSDITGLINAVAALPPEFNPDGSISRSIVPSHVGLASRELKKWNSFTPSPNGSDIQICKVAPGTEVSREVYDAVREGTANIREESDGSTTISYKGTRRSAYITLGELQRSAVNVLNIILQSAVCQKVYNEETGYEPVEIMPFYKD